MVGGLKMITVRAKQSGTKHGWQLKRSGPDTFRQRLGSDFDRGATSHIFTFFRHATLSTDLQSGWLVLFYFWGILSNSMVRHVGCRQQFAWSQWAWVGSVGWVGGWRFQLAIARFLNLNLDWQHLLAVQKSSINHQITTWDSDQTLRFLCFRASNIIFFSSEGQGSMTSSTWLGNSINCDPPFLSVFWSRAKPRFWSWSSGEILKLNFGLYFAADACLRSWSWCLVETLKLGLV